MPQPNQTLTVQLLYQGHFSSFLLGRLQHSLLPQHKMLPENLEELEKLGKSKWRVPVVLASMDRRGRSSWWVSLHASSRTAAGARARQPPTLVSGVSGSWGPGPWPDFLPCSWAWETERSEAFWQMGHTRLSPEGHTEPSTFPTSSLGAAFRWLKNRQHRVRGPSHQVLPGGTL